MTTKAEKTVTSPQAGVLEDDELMQQNDERGPGWFLKISYLVIGAFMVYYLFTYWDWKSNYQEQQEQIQQQIGK